MGFIFESKGCETLKKTVDMSKGDMLYLNSSSARVIESNNRRTYA